MRFNRTRKCKKRTRKNRTMKNLGGNTKQAKPIFIHARGIENTIPLVCPICKNNLLHTNFHVKRWKMGFLLRR